MFQAGHESWGMVDPDWDTDYLPSDKTTLGEMLEEMGVNTFRDLYDFDDGWQHCIRTGKLASSVVGEIYPQLTHTKGRCPPEDVGGVPGYAYFLDVMADKKHPEYVELSEWYGEHFDPADSGEEELRKNVNQLANWYFKVTPSK